MLRSGKNFNIAITACGEVYSWGRNVNGQLGIGHDICINMPQLVEFFKDKQIKEIICGNYHTFAITEDGDVYSWGRNHSGQLGLGHQRDYLNIPQPVKFFKDKQIKKIICGGNHIFAITKDGEIYSWGYNYFGQLGLGHNNNQNIPQLVEFFKDKQIKEIICGDTHTIAVTEIGEIYSWGKNYYCQLGLGYNDRGRYSGKLGSGNNNDQNVPRLVEFFKNKQIKEIKCGGNHTIAITENNDVYSWGKNIYGQLGLGHQKNQNIPQRVGFFKDKRSSMLQRANLQIKKIICGEYHTFVITEIGEVYSWGLNSDGQLGLGHDNNQNKPQLVEFFKNKQIKKIKCGGDHTIAITNCGDIYSWGGNIYGELGLGSQRNQNIPQQVEFFKEHPIFTRIINIKSARGATFNS